MTDVDLDHHLRALFAESSPTPDPAFVNRVVALAAYDIELRRVRRLALARIAGEAAALAASLGAFALLSSVPSSGGAGLGDTIGLASPAMLGLVLLSLWALVAGRDPAIA